MIDLSLASQERGERAERRLDILLSAEHARAQLVCAHLFVERDLKIQVEGCFIM